MGEEKQYSTLEKMAAIPGMLFFGTLTIVTQKFLFETTAYGLPKYATEEVCNAMNPPQHAGCQRKFSKPWFQVETMFIGMFLCLVVYEAKRWWEGRQAAKAEELQPLVGKGEGQVKRDWSVYLKILGPGICDLFATWCTSAALLFIPASVWQMMRGSMVIFSSIECVVFLKRKLKPYNWCGVGIVVFALCLVGVAAVMSSAETSTTSSSQTVMGMSLVLFGQILQASQVVIEDLLLHDYEVSAVLIVGVEGFWGTLITSFIMIPIVRLLPGQEGNGIREDIVDTMTMLGNTPSLIWIAIGYTFAVCAYNMTAMLVTQQTSAVVRTIMEACRTACIWVVQVILYYSLDGTEYGATHEVGEQLTKWSALQAVGFGFLVLGSMVYGAVIKLPMFFEYVLDEAAMMEIEGNLKDSFGRQSF
eukprot:NODE_662_length_1445_cov_295.104585_g500_i0.p1 GENE.NODE_662_length_1445_cov_295.104585_g500_i0~~NODE_662_length_1445_cov_295.104585_g500_i0.p1  ORF type:complete len:436 (+),score=120.70 NODE_662_length_1445_cov_295.104585_g500_i0:59-1309(+)